MTLVPPAAMVGPQIARFSGRAFTPVTEVVTADELDEPRAEALLLGSPAILDGR